MYSKGSGTDKQKKLNQYPNMPPLLLPHAFLCTHHPPAASGAEAEKEAMSVEWCGGGGVLLYLAIEGHCWGKLYSSVIFVVLSTSLCYYYRGQLWEKAREPGDC